MPDLLPRQFPARRPWTPAARRLAALCVQCIAPKGRPSFLAVAAELRAMQPRRAGQNVGPAAEQGAARSAVVEGSPVGVGKTSK